MLKIAALALMVANTMAYPLYKQCDPRWARH
jgi:hypothetical protein